MSFFKDFKEDLSQAVSELMPSDAELLAKFEERERRANMQEENIEVFTIPDEETQILTESLKQEENAALEDGFIIPTEVQEEPSKETAATIELPEIEFPNMEDDIPVPEIDFSVFGLGEETTETQKETISEPEGMEEETSEQEMEDDNRMDFDLYLEKLLAEITDGNTAAKENKRMGKPAVTDESETAEEYEMLEEAAETENFEILKEAAKLDEVEMPEESIETESTETSEEAAETESVEMSEKTAETESVEMLKETAETESIEMSEETAETEGVEMSEKTAETESVKMPEGTVESENFGISEDVTETEEYSMPEEAAEFKKEETAEETGEAEVETDLFTELHTEEIKLEEETILEEFIQSKEENTISISEEEKTMDMEMETKEITETMEESSIMTDGTPTSEDVAVITKGMRIKGDVESDGSIEIVGDIMGNVTCKGKLTISGKVNGNSRAAEIFVNQARIEGEIVSDETVKVGNGTVIIGNISASSAVVAGAVKGDIDVNGPVVVDASAVVMGNIKSRSVQINSGAVIEGTISQCYNEVNVQGIFDEK